MALPRFAEVSFIIFAGLCVLYSNSLPVTAPSDSSSESASEESGELESGQKLLPPRNKSKDMYVVRAVIYEIGILTDSSDEDNSTSFENQERVDLTFFDAHRNDSHINFGRVPLPIQTNISGQVLTGIAPVDLGAFSSPADLLQALPISGTIVNITHSDTSYFQLKASNLTDFEKPRVIIDSDLDTLPELANSISDLSLPPAKEEPQRKPQPVLASNCLLA